MRYRLSRLFKALMRLICRAVLRAVITGLIVIACLMITLAYLGIPLPDLYELLEWFESVSQLAKILS